MLLIELKFNFFYEFVITVFQFTQRAIENLSACHAVGWRRLPALVILAYQTKATVCFKKNSFTIYLEQLPANHSHKATDGCQYQSFLIGK
jgi:hypothetical protein